MASKTTTVYECDICQSTCSDNCFTDESGIGGHGHIHIFGDIHSRNWEGTMAGRVVKDKYEVCHKCLSKVRSLVLDMTFPKGDGGYN